MTSVSVVICAYTERRWQQLERAVRSVVSQPVTNDLVVVIDHNPDLLERAQAAWPKHRVIANRHHRGLSGARNTGVEATDGDVIAFLDDDAHAHAGWLAELIQPFDDDRVGLTGGTVLPEWSEPQPPWFPDEFLWVVGCSYEGLPTTPAEIRNPIGASMAVRRAVFDEVGGFVDGIGRVGTVPLGCEETELAIRAAERGYAARFVPGSIVSHHVSADRNTIGYFVRRCHAEGRSKAIVARSVGSSPALASERAYVTHTLVRGIARRSWRAVTGPRRTSAIGEVFAIAAGCVAAATGYAQAAIRPSRRLRRSDLRVGDPAAT